MNKLEHIALIMDGNSRWAVSQGLDAYYGHLRGTQNIEPIIEKACEIGIKYITLFALSTENLSRPQEEVNYLNELFHQYIDTKLDSMSSKGIRLKVIGDMRLIDHDLQNKINDAVNMTQHNDKITVCIAFAYGGRIELINAVNKAIARCSNEEVDIDAMSKLMYDPEMPDVDLLIRTGGNYRISNFLLWHISYAELYFLDKYWPDFNENDMNIAIDEFYRRRRTFGGRNL